MSTSISIEAHVLGGEAVLSHRITDGK
jgi:hypothetical protein